MKNENDRNCVTVIFDFTKDSFEISQKKTLLIYCIHKNPTLQVINRLINIISLKNYLSLVVLATNICVMQLATQYLVGVGVAIIQCRKNAVMSFNS